MLCSHRTLSGLDPPPSTRLTFFRLTPNYLDPLNQVIQFLYQSEASSSPTPR
ncbi:hypothetical protein HanRHA438_Chr03g0124941 [Helianthus annuus]|nr:hypothetical protein HanRHA438_Chr03g0124941 [Helianthus annuus]